MKDVRYLTRGGFGAFMLLVLAMHFIKPWLNPLQHGISEYTSGNFGFLMILAYFVLGFGFVGLAFQSFGAFRNLNLAYLCCFLFLISAFSSFLLGIFPINPQGAPFLLSAHIHRQIAPILFLSVLLGISIYSFRMRFERGFREYYGLAIVLLSISWISFIIMLVFRQDPSYMGITQRLFVLCTWLWLAMTSLKFT